MLELTWNNNVVSLKRNDHGFLEDLLIEGAIKAFDESFNNATLVKIVCIDAFTLELHFSFEVNRVVIKGEEFLKNSVNGKNILETFEIASEFELVENAFEPKIQLSLKQRLGKVMLMNSEKVTVIINKFFKDTYPDFPFEVKELEVEANQTLSEIISVPKGHIYSIEIYHQEELIENEVFYGIPLYYFSNVESLKKDIEQYMLPIQSDDETMKSLIGEKSSVVKKAFGLLKENTTDVELIPILKNVVNLYCIKDLMSLGFINGTIGVNGPDAEATAKGAKLGNFSVSGASDENGVEGTYQGKLSIGVMLIEDLIKKQESLLYSSLFKKCYGIRTKGGYINGKNRCSI